jgi:exosome complex component RRP43
MPIACTAVIFTGKETKDQAADGKFWMLADPDTLEESLCDETVTIVIDCAGGSRRILSISKHGGTVMTAKLLGSKEFLDWASKRWEDFASAMTGGR